MSADETNKLIADLKNSFQPKNLKIRIEWENRSGGPIAKSVSEELLGEPYFLSSAGIFLYQTFFLGVIFPVIVYYIPFGLVKK